MSFGAFPEHCSACKEEYQRRALRPGQLVRIAAHRPGEAHMVGVVGVVMAGLDGGPRTTPEGNIVIQVDGLYSVDYAPDELERLT